MDKYDPVDDAFSIMGVETDEVYKKLGAKIYELRRAFGYSQADLAKKVGLSRPSIANIEAGRQAVCLHQLPLFTKAFRNMPMVNFLRGVLFRNKTQDEKETP